MKSKKKGPFVYEYPKADNTVDAVVFGLDLDDAQLQLLLVRRGEPPFQGAWALPGGFVELDEDLDDAVRRELSEETGLKLAYLEQLRTFGAPGRDPRGRVISTAYLALVRPEAVEGADDAIDAAWWPVTDLPDLAFDHAEIIRCGLGRLRGKLPWKPVGINLLPPTFTLTELQQVYEVVLGRELDKRNFRRKVNRFDVLVPIDYETNEAHRPAQLFRFDKKRYAALEAEGVDFEVA